MASMNASTAGLRALRLILDMAPNQAGAELGRISPYLTYPDDQKAFDFIRAHFSTNGKMPHPDTLLDQITVYLPPSQETYEFEVVQLRNRFIEDEMRAASDAASALLQEGKASEALTTMLGKLLPVTQGHAGYQLTDMRQSAALAFYNMQLNDTAPEVERVGYPTLDKQGGIEDGDMIGIVGRPASGKTWLMLATCIAHWATYQEPVLFVTQEMAAKQIERRAIPIIAQVHPTPLYLGKPIQYEIGGPTQEQYMAALEQAMTILQGSKAPFLIYDSKMAGTVADIESIAALHGVRRVWIDGAYMLRHPDPKLGRYARVPENLDFMKQWCQRTGTAVFSSWQFKRGAGKDDAAGDSPDLDDIGYSHAIGEYMGLILGLLENPKSVTQMNKKRITVMKGRNGEVGGFDIHWNFATMNFEEISKSEIETNLVYL